MAEVVSVPTTQEIDRLPRLARVAFAARCARRVLPKFRQAWPDAPAVYAEAVRAAVELAERTGAGEPVPESAYGSPDDDAASVARSAAQAAFKHVPHDSNHSRSDAVNA